MNQNASIDKRNLQIIKQLGTGSYGTVHLVKKQENNQLYALKSAKLNTMNHDDKEKALNEIRLLASIESPYVIRYQTAFFDHNTSTLCIMMQYAEEGDLTAIISHLKEKKSNEDQPFGFEQSYILEIAFGLLQGLKTLHQKKIVHRDLKSANIFFSHGIPKIGDLNVSKVICNQLCSTQTGTPYYTCPEVWKGTPYNQKCDIWSLGVLLYEMCCLCFPFCARQFAILIRKIIKGEYKPISNKYSENMSTIIKMCLTLQPNERPSAQDLLKLQVFSVFHQKYKSFISMNGTMDLLQSIRLPRIMTLLDRKLKKLDQSRKKVTFTGKITNQNEFHIKNSTNIFKIAKKHSMKKFKSQKIIGRSPSQNKQNNATINNIDHIRGQIAQIFSKKNNLHSQAQGSNKQVSLLKKINANRVKSLKRIKTVQNQGSDEQQRIFLDRK